MTSKRELVIFIFANIELAISTMFSFQVSQPNSRSLEKWQRDNEISISEKIRALRLANIYPEPMANDLLILARIRNEYAHNPFVKKNVFDRLGNIQLDDEEVKKMPNDFPKFLKVGLIYNAKLVQMSPVPIMVGTIQTHDFSEWMPEKQENSLVQSDEKTKKG